MSLQSAQIAYDETGVNASKTLLNIINALFALSGKGLMRVTDVGFFREESGLVFKIKLKHVASPDSLDVFYDCFKMDKHQVAMTSFSRMRAELTFLTADAVIKLFRETGYEALMNDNQLCLAHQVDLLQLMLTDNIHRIIVDSNISPNPPEMIEFDKRGNLSAVVISPQNVRYQLENTSEVCSFLKQKCQYELSDCFVDLIGLQQIIAQPVIQDRVLDEWDAQTFYSQSEYEYDVIASLGDDEIPPLDVVPQQSILSVRADADRDRMMGVLTQVLSGLGFFDTSAASSQSSDVSDAQYKRQRK